MAETTAGTALNDAVTGPKKVVVDGTVVEQHDLMDLIEADRHEAAKRASKKGLGLKITRTVNPGAV